MNFRPQSKVACLRTLSQSPAELSLKPDPTGICGHTASCPLPPARRHPHRGPESPPDHLLPESGASLRRFLCRTQFCASHTGDETDPLRLLLTQRWGNRLPPRLGDLILFPTSVQPAPRPARSLRGLVWNECPARDAQDGGVGRKRGGQGGRAAAPSENTFLRLQSHENKQLIHAHTHTRMYTYTYLHTHEHIHAHPYGCTYTHVHTQMYTYMHPHAPTHTCTPIQMYKHTQMHTHTQMYIYTYLHIHT